MNEIGKDKNINRRVQNLTRFCLAYPGLSFLEMLGLYRLKILHPQIDKHEKSLSTRFTSFFLWVSETSKFPLFLWTTHEFCALDYRTTGHIAKLLSADPLMGDMAHRSAKKISADVIACKSHSWSQYTVE